jgi:hypothetical protein
MKKSSVFLACLLSGCSADKPTNEELLGALTELSQKKACLTSGLFSVWPAKADSITRNKDIMDRLAEVGLLTYSNGSFNLTSKGKDFFDAEQSGFCFASGHIVSDIDLIKEIPKEQLPSAVYKAWQISFNVTPMVEGEWIDNTALLKKLGVDLSTITRSQKLSLRIIKRDKASKIELSDPRFSYTPNHSFKTGW